MNRRRVLLTGGGAAVGCLAGCTTRATGWSTLRIILDNGLENAVLVDVVVRVNGTNAATRKVRLDPKATQQFAASIDIPWNATLAFSATRRQTDAQATREWVAQVPLWGGNKCMIEPVIIVDSEGIRITPACRG